MLMKEYVEETFKSKQGDIRVVILNIREKNRN